MNLSSGNLFIKLKAVSILIKVYFFLKEIKFWQVHNKKKSKTIDLTEEEMTQVFTKLILVEKVLQKKESKHNWNFK